MEIKGVLSKLKRALLLIEQENASDSRLPRLKSDVTDMENKFANMIFFEGENEMK
jgi:hypothetical protein